MTRRISIKASPRGASSTSGAYDPTQATAAFGVDHHASCLRFRLGQAGEAHHG